MPWGKTKKAAKARDNFLKKRKDITAKAKALHRSHVKHVIGEEMQVLHGALAWRAVDAFKDKYDIWATAVLLVLIIDSYKVFTTRDAYSWGIAYCQQNLYRLIAYCKERDLIAVSGAQRSRSHYLTLTGKKMVNEFNEFYKERAKLIFKSNENDNRELVYKYSTNKPKRSYKLDDTAKG